MEFEQSKIKADYNVYIGTNKFNRLAVINIEYDGITSYIWKGWPVGHAQMKIPTGKSSMTPRLREAHWNTLQRPKVVSVGKINKETYSSHQSLTLGHRCQGCNCLKYCYVAYLGNFA